MHTLICVAAGLSSRMGSFKPLLPLGEQTIIRMLIERYRSCGIDQVILVTGHNADLLEEHVRDLNVLCCRNEQYATSDMFQSVKVGIRTYLAEAAMQAEGDRVLITPCDIPLVSAQTVELLLNAVGDICVPVSDGKQGHPLCLSRHVLIQILAYRGDDGLRGALRALNLAITQIPVDDPGILVDSDTPEDYRQLQQLFSTVYCAQ